MLLGKLEYLVRYSLAQLSNDSHRWRSLPVSYSALTARLAELGYGPTLCHSLQENCLKLNTLNFEKNEKGTVTFINRGYLEKLFPYYTFTFCLEKPVDKDVKIIIFLIQAHERGCVAKAKGLSGPFMTTHDNFC